MGKLKPGDRISCKIRSGHVVNAYESDWEEKRTFEIVAADNRGYYIYVPHYVYLKGGLKINEYNSKNYGIDKKFIGEVILYISENSVVDVETKADGLNCVNCKEFYPMAECEDFVFICWLCRNYPYR